MKGVPAVGTWAGCSHASGGQFMEILFATDGSVDAAVAGAFLESLPLPADATIHVVSVITHPEMPAGPVGDELSGRWADLEALYRAEEEQVKRDVAQAAASLGRAGTRTTTEIRRGGAAAEIITAAAAAGAELVVAGSKGRTGLASFLLGSVSCNVARHAGRPVLVGRPVRHGLQQAVIAVDASENAGRAAAFAARFPLPARTVFVATHVLRPLRPSFGDDQMDPDDLEAVRERLSRERSAAAAELLRNTAACFGEAGRSLATEVREGDPAEEVLALAEARQADLIVAGARGTSLIEGLVAGSVADRLLSHAECSVLVVP